MRFFSKQHDDACRGDQTAHAQAIANARAANEGAADDIARCIPRAALLLGTHAALAVVFAFFGIWFLAAVNVCGAITYAIAVPVLRSGRTAWFMPTAQMAIAAHMVCAVACLGWSYGFQLHAFSLVATAFYSKYLDRHANLERRYGMPFIVSIAVLFLVLRVTTSSFTPLYRIDSTVVPVVFFAANAATTFAVIILYLMRFDHMVANAEERLHKMANQDVLTALSNRRRMMQVADEVFSRPMGDGSQIAVALLDVDDFKTVNDEYGHDGGDFALKMLAKNISKLESPHLHASRWGGEEFVVIADGSNAYALLHAHMDDLIARVPEQVCMYRGERIPLSLTCGMVCRRPGESFEGALKRADSLMYIGKARGKNCLVDETNNRPLRPAEAV